MFYFICYDLETGGLDEHKNPITEIALIVYDAETLKEVDRFESLIKPYDNLTLEPKALEVTGITKEMLKQGEQIEDIVEVLIAIFETYTKGSSKFKLKPILVGHNIQEFDNKFLEYAFERQEKNLYDYIGGSQDTLNLGRARWVGQQKKFNLTSCCKSAGVEVVDAHRAINDVEANKELHINFINAMRSNSNQESGTESQESPRVQFKF